MLQRINILIVDDDLDDHDFFRDAAKTLPIVGCNISSVYNGLQAMDYLLKRNAYRKSQDVLPDLIVLDLNMPVVDGWGVLKELKKQKELKNIPVYVLTTSKDEGQKKECLRLGCQGFFSKPPKLEELSLVVKQMLDQISTD